jgi:hypothetical protein
MPPSTDNTRLRTRRTRPVLDSVLRPRVWVPMVAYALSASAVTATHVLADRAADRRNHLWRLGNDDGNPFEDRVRYINEGNELNHAVDRFLRGAAGARAVLAVTFCLHVASELWRCLTSGETRRARGTEWEIFSPSFQRYE